MGKNTEKVEPNQKMIKMRVIHTINPNTFKTYFPSESTYQLLGVQDRTIRSEDVKWDQNLPLSLVDLCIQVLVKDFQKKPILKELPIINAAVMLELLSTNLPLTLTVPLLEDSIFWKRSCEERWNSMNFVEDHRGSWKQMYLERHLEEYLEKLDPDDYSPMDMSDLVKLCAPYIYRLQLRELVHSKITVPRKKGAKSHEGDPLNHNHINLHSVLKYLPKLEVFDLVFSVRNMGMDFNPELFVFSKVDCYNIGLGILSCEFIKTFRLHRSLLDDGRLACLIQYFLFTPSLEELDVSNCQISNDGANVLAHFTCKHLAIKKIIAINNKIGPKGAYSIAYGLSLSLNHLQVLNLRLNTIGDEGIGYICSVLLKSKTPVELIVAGCGFTSKGGKHIGQMLSINTSLKKLDICNNDIGEEGGVAILLAFHHNTTIIKLDLRMTGVSNDQEYKLNQCVENNIGLTKQMKQDSEIVDSKAELGEENADYAAKRKFLQNLPFPTKDMDNELELIGTEQQLLKSPVTEGWNAQDHYSNLHLVGSDMELEKTATKEPETTKNETE